MELIINNKLMLQALLILRGIVEFQKMQHK